VRRLQRAEGGGGQGHTLIQASLWGQGDDLGGWVSPQAGPGQLDTGGLDVPMDDALRVGAVQCGSDLFDHPRSPQRCQPAFHLYQSGQRPLRRIFHDKGSRVPVMELIGRGDVRVPQTFHHSRLTPEPLGRDGIP